MNCLNPYVRGELVVPCQDCENCEVDAKRVLTLRLMLEQRVHEKSCFLTLTYNDDHLPKGGTLVPRDATLFLKRLRKKMSPIQLRFFLVGEYGSLDQRPHYHAIVYGINSDETEIMRSAWVCPNSKQSIGFIMVGDLTLKSAQYVSGYLIDRKTNGDDPETKKWLRGRHPEFTRRSNKPGLGALEVPNIIDSLTTNNGVHIVESLDGMPSVITLEGRKFAIGRYLKQKCRERYGDDLEKETSQWKRRKEALRQLLKENGYPEKLNDYEKKQAIRYIFRDKRNRKIYLNKLYQQKKGSL